MENSIPIPGWSFSNSNFFIFVHESKWVELIQVDIWVSNRPIQLEWFVNFDQLSFYINTNIISNLKWKLSGEFQWSSCAICCESYANFIWVDSNFTYSEKSLVALTPINFLLDSIYLPKVFFESTKIRLNYFKIFVCLNQAIFFLVLALKIYFCYQILNESNCKILFWNRHFHSFVWVETSQFSNFWTI